jgi:hypothetical protein
MVAVCSRCCRRRNVRPQQTSRARRAKPKTEPRRAPSCPGLRVVEGEGARVAELVGVEVVVSVEVGPSPRVTMAVMVVRGRVIIWVTIRPWRSAKYPGVPAVVAMVLREEAEMR